MKRKEGNSTTFVLGDMIFEYDEHKNQYNIERHGISFEYAARVFFDYDRIEMYDDENSKNEDRYNTIGSIGGGKGEKGEIIFVVYTERIKKVRDGKQLDITRLISARIATTFERGIYYGKY